MRKKRAMASRFVSMALAGACLLICISASCDNGQQKALDNQDMEASGIFKIDGIEYRGITSVQTFANGNYSIVCEQNDPYKFIQITFHNRVEAEKGGTFKAAEYEMDIPLGYANVGIDGQTFDPDEDCNIHVSDKKIVLQALKLTQTGGGGKTVHVQSASIRF